MLKISSNENAFIEISISRTVLHKIPLVVLVLVLLCLSGAAGFFFGRKGEIRPKVAKPARPALSAVAPMVQSAVAPVIEPPIKPATGDEAKTADPIAVPDRATALKAGPWGTMESLSIFIEPPEEYLATETIQTADRRWWFRGYSPDLLIALLKSVGLNASQQAELLDQSKWQHVDGKTVIAPSKELVLSLSPHARKQIYGVLADNPENLVTHIRCSFPADRFDTILSESGLAAKAVTLIKSLTFPHGRFLFFCDAPAVLDTLETYEQKVSFMKMLARKETLLLKLHVMPDSDINSLLNYWVKASWSKDVKPMLETLKKVPGGARIDVVHLLPPLPTESLYTYPFPSTDPADLHKDCHWTALNFFRDAPDSSFTNPEVVRETMKKDYYPVLSDMRYGDVIMLTRQDGTIIHSAVFIADNIVYTKNSPLYLDPFILMTLPDMIDKFEAFLPENERVKVMVYRGKYY